jgi:hypothetical protein
VILQEVQVSSFEELQIKISGTAAAVGQWQYEDD